MNINTDKLRGRHVYLEALSPAHKESLRQLAKDERIWEFNLGLLINETYDTQFDNYFATALNPQARGEQYTFVIHEAAGMEIIGMTRFYELDEKEKRVAIGYTWYTPVVWGKVYNKECKLLLLQYAFEEMHFNRVELTVVHENVRSQKAIEKIGGVKEGILRKHGYRNDGTLKDTVIFSIINDEWPSKKEKLMQLISENENH